MKNIFFCLTFILFTSFVNGQILNQEPILLNIEFEFIHVNNLNDKEKPVKKSMVLSVGQNSSRYIDGETYLRSITEKQSSNSQIKYKSAVGMPIVVVNEDGGIITESFFQFPKSQKLNTISNIGNNSYLVESQLKKIDWKILSETKKIDAFNCQKAIGDFGGRTYTAWFTSELPFLNGPYKLWGLPGLILEAEDSKKEVRFIFKKIDKEVDSTKKVAFLGTKPIKITYSEYLKAKKNFIATPESFMQGQLPIGSPQVTTFEKNKVVEKKKVIKNPIEL
jgi:GLPGLI family protein